MSPFLVQEWEWEVKGSMKETLRLDVMSNVSHEYKDADIILFNTGHWWTHEKTSKGEDYYQEGTHVYTQLNVVEAFRRAITTWGRWIDANLNPATNSLLLFRAYSASHFRYNGPSFHSNLTSHISHLTFVCMYVCITVEGSGTPGANVTMRQTPSRMMHTSHAIQTR